MLRIGVLGCGRIGEMHADNIQAHPDTELAAVFDVHSQSAEKVAARHGVPAFANSDRMFDDDRVEAVLIAAPTETHCRFIEQAVASSRPVLCEKPIDLDLGRVDECRRRIAGARTPIQLGFNRRFDPGHRSVRDAVHGGEIGDLWQVVITSRDPQPPPREYCMASGGLFRDMTIHDFDLARYMLGEEPARVFAVAGQNVQPELMAELGDHDTAMIILTTDSGKQCFINNSRAATYGYDQRVEMLGSGGMIISDNVAMNSVRRYSADMTGSGAPYQPFFVERYLDSYMAEIQAFAACVVNGTGPEVGFEDGRQALVLADAAYLSLSEGRIVDVREIAG